MSPRASKGTNTRTDLITPKLPAGTVEKGQAYGARTSQEQSLAMLPLGGPTPAAAPPASAAPAGPASPPGPAVPAAPAGPIPTPFEANGHWTQTPSTNPNPVTSGLPNGPGPGSEAQGPLMKSVMAQAASEQGSLQTLLSHLASQPGASSMTKSLASAAGVRT